MVVLGETGHWLEGVTQKEIKKLIDGYITRNTLVHLRRKIKKTLKTPKLCTWFLSDIPLDLNQFNKMLKFFADWRFTWWRGGKPIGWYTRLTNSLISVLMKSFPTQRNWTLRAYVAIVMKVLVFFLDVLFVLPEYRFVAYVTHLGTEQKKAPFTVVLIVKHVDSFIYTKIMKRSLNDSS